MLRWFNFEGDWSEQELDEFFDSRGMVRSFDGEGFVDRMSVAAYGI